MTTIKNNLKRNWLKFEHCSASSYCGSHMAVYRLAKIKYPVVRTVVVDNNNSNAVE